MPLVCRVVPLALCLAVAPAVLAAQPARVVAFGDSITRGYGDGANDCSATSNLGYPPRVETQLRAAGYDLELVNAGVCGEQTPEGVTRIAGVLASQGAQVAVIMEGTNDVSGLTSVETIRFNVREMARKAEVRGVRPVILSVIPRGPGSGHDANNQRTASLAGWLAHQAGLDRRLFADPFKGLIDVSNLFGSYYSDPWHVNGSGYDLLAEIVVGPVRRALDDLAKGPSCDQSSDASQPVVAKGSARYCTECGPCAAGEGDCDRDDECQAGLVCADNIGAQFGFNPGIDVCIEPLGGGAGGGSGGGGGPGGGGAGPGDGGCSVAAGTGRYCTECGPCQHGEGDCDRDAECAAGLTCSADVGAQFGFGPKIDVCTAGGGACPAAGSGRYCSECGPCAAGEGDCDHDGECLEGLRCVDNVGPQFGFGPNIDVCM